MTKEPNSKCLNCRKKSATYGFFCSPTCEREFNKKKEERKIEQ